MCFGTVLLVEFLNCKVNDHIIIHVALMVRRICVKKVQIVSRVDKSLSLTGVLVTYSAYAAALLFVSTAGVGLVVLIFLCWLFQQWYKYYTSLSSFNLYISQEFFFFLRFSN